MNLEEGAKNLLERGNIRMGCKAQPKEEVIRQLGRMLSESGYVEEAYVEAMLMREKSFSTYMGNGLALPHGVEASKSSIRATGLAVMMFPEGTDWDGNEVKVAIGIAAVGEEHLQILSALAEVMLEEGAADDLSHSDVEGVYKVLGGR